MLFDLEKFPISEDGTQVKDEKGVPGNYKIAFMRALIVDFDGQGQPIRGDEKFKRFDMYMRIKLHNSGELIDLTAEDMTFLTNVCRDAYPTLVAGQCRDFLRKPETSQNALARPPESSGN